MRKMALLCSLVFTCISLSAQEGSTLKGRVEDKDSKEGLAFATVTIPGTSHTTATDRTGSFLIPALSPGKITVRVSHVGYETKDISIELTAGSVINLSIQLTSQTQSGEEIVISATKRPEKINFAPASIHVITAKDLGRFAGSNMSELYSTIQGVEYNRSGVDEITVNARGLNSVFQC
jgi:iron complex outermembrane receptor protein